MVFVYILKSKLHYDIFLIIISILILYKTRIVKSELSEIKLVINGIGNHKILNNSFQISPSEVIVISQLKKFCYKTCYLENYINNVIIRFNTDITSCVNMLNYLNNIIEADLSNFDASKVIDMSYMFFNCIGLKKINLGNIDTSLVKSIHSI